MAHCTSLLLRGHGSRLWKHTAFGKKCFLSTHLHFPIPTSVPSQCTSKISVVPLFPIQFSDHGVALSAVDMLSLLREVFGDMTQLCPPLVTKVIKSLCVAAAVSMSNREQHQTVIPILLCLRDWFMMLPSMKEGGMLPPPVTATVFEVR